MELETYIYGEIVPRYAAFDRAHGIDHVQTVIAESLALAEHYDVDRQMVLAIAAYHDTGLVEGRATHHLVSGRIVRQDTRLHEWFSPGQIEVMACAVEDHRASSGHPPRSVYGRIVAEADRIIDPETTLRRTVQYGLANYPELDEEDQYRRFEGHLLEKYAEGGYLKLWIPESKNHTRLVALRRIIADKALLRNIFDRIYSEEKLAGQGGRE